MSATLAEIARRVGLADDGRHDRIVLDEVEDDSRRVCAGALFCCVPGADTDGHLHASAAVDGGAVALMVERRLELDVPQLVVPSVRASMGSAAAAVHGDPSADLTVVGVTGTNGKTTAVRLIAGVLNHLGVATREIGTLTGVRTTPEAPELQRVFATARAEGTQAVAMEVSSHALDQRRVDGTRFAVAAFTNLGVDHLDHHGTMEDYFTAKQRLFTRELAEAAVIDVRDEWGARLAAETPLPVSTVSEAELADAVTRPGSSTFTWRGHAVELPLAGVFNVANALLAVKVVHDLGHDPADIAAALADAPPIPGRFETIDEGQEFTVVVDYAHTPEGLEAVLTAARALTERSLVVVFGAGGDRDRSKRPRMGEVARRLADRVVVTNDNPRGEVPDAIVSAIVAGMRRPPDLVEPDRRAAIRHAVSGARKGDVVLIAGKGHESTQTVGDDVVGLDDREVAREELKHLGGLR